MAMEIRKTFSSGFTLTEQRLRRIYDIAEERMKKIGGGSTLASFKLSFKNKKRVERNSIDEVLAEKNGDNWAIETLTITFSIKQKESISPIETIEDNRIIIDFDTNNASSAFSFSVSGTDRDWATLTAYQLEDAIAIVKTFSPSSLFLKPLISFIGSAILGVLISGLATYISISNINGTILSQILVSPFFYVALALVVILVGGTGIGLYLVPSYTFYWGDNSKIVDRRVAISRYLIFFAVSIVVFSIIAVIITNLLIAKSGGDFGGGSGF